ncbi:MAG TPA: S1C family serine protease [Acetobacteraceae bacterium]|nr:S1C family serine protease [Acetobacteraceae bacterium]
MAIGLTTALAELSDAIATQVAAAARMLAAIRIGPNRHVSGILWQQDLVITSDQALPVQDSYTLVLPGGVLTAARPARRNAVGNLASLRLEGTANPVQIMLPAEPRVGALALALAADADAAPMVRLSVIHKLSANGSDLTLTLDMPANLVAEGGPVLDAAGALLGMATIGAGGEATVIPHASMTRMLDAAHAQINGRRGWLGVALQPITVPEAMRSAVGQASGRMVVSVAPSGPAELAGLRPGDILLSMDGHSISGAHALRAFLGPERVGRQVAVRLMRDGQVETRQLTIVPQPAD